MEIAQALYEWLPIVLQNVEPFMSEEIEKGTRWASRVAYELQFCKFGLICLTPDNLTASWIYFEAGALAKVVGQSHVAPVLFRLKPSDIQGPLTQFQAVNLTAQKDMMRLIKSINEAAGAEARDERTLEKAFNGLWGLVEGKLKSLPETDLEKEKIAPSIDSMQRSIEEVLTLVREQSQIPAIIHTVQKHWTLMRERETELESAALGQFEQLAQSLVSVLDTWAALNASLRIKESNREDVQVMNDKIIEFSTMFNRAHDRIRLPMFPSTDYATSAVLTRAAIASLSGSGRAPGAFSSAAMRPGAGTAGLGSPPSLLAAGGPDTATKPTD
jgi:hypothetical protein